MKTTIHQTAKRAETDSYYESKISFLEQENKILRGAVTELKRQIEIKEADLKEQEEDYKSLLNEYNTIQDAFVLAKSLIHIPDNIRDMVKELLKARLLIWDKAITYNGGIFEDVRSKDRKPIEGTDRFEWVTAFADVFDPKE